MAVAMARAVAVAVVMATVAAAMAMGAAAVTRWGGDAARAVAAGGWEVEGKKEEEGLKDAARTDKMKSRTEEREEEVVTRARPRWCGRKRPGHAGKSTGEKKW